VCREERRKKEDEEVLGAFNFGGTADTPSKNTSTPNTPTNSLKSSILSPTVMKINSPITPRRNGNRVGDLEPSQRGTPLSKNEGDDIITTKYVTSTDDVVACKRNVAKTRASVSFDAKTKGGDLDLNGSSSSKPGRGASTASDHSDDDHTDDDTTSRHDVTMDDVIAQSDVTPSRASVVRTASSAVTQKDDVTTKPADVKRAPKSDTKKTKKKSAFGSYNLNHNPDDLPPFTLVQNLTGENYHFSANSVIPNDEAINDVMPVGDESPTFSEKRGKKSVFGSYDLGFTPSKGMKKMGKDSNLNDEEPYLNKYFLNRL
jgi:hypothetical protein